MNKKFLPRHLQKIQNRLDVLSKNFRMLMASGAFQEAYEQAINAHRLIPKSVLPLSDAATAAVKGGLWHECITCANKALKIDPNHINSLDALAHAYAVLNDWENSGKYSKRALILRDKMIMKSNPIPPSLGMGRADSGGKQVISFSLFGDSSEYIEPAIINAQIVAEIYPNWVCRFYVDHTVPELAIQLLYNEGAEIIQVEESIAHWPGTMWRFLAMDDPEVSRVIFRDADSVISWREAVAVAEWITSGKLFHTLRDGGSHTELILAGLWGGVAGAVPNMRGKIENYLSRPIHSSHFADQYFLREMIWPFVRQSLYANDRLFSFMDSHSFPAREGFDFHNFHTGCNEGNARFNAAVDIPNGTKVEWTLFTKIEPNVNSDYSLRIEKQERKVCSYITTISNGELTALIPRRYAQGIATGDSTIRLSIIKD